MNIISAFLVTGCIALALPGLVAAETSEESYEQFLAERAKAEEAGAPKLIVKGKPKLIPKDVIIEQLAKPPAPGGASGVPGVTPGVPGVPGGAPGVPGVTPGIAGVTPGVPGVTPGIPGVTPGIPGVTGGAPGIPGVTPGPPSGIVTLPAPTPGVIPPLPPMQPGICVFTSNLVQFDYGSARLRPESYPQLLNVVAALTNPALFHVPFFFIDGHTCDIGSDENNCRLSWERANSVVAFLLQSGVPSHRLVARGFGERAPMYPNVSEEVRSMNRRVVLKNGSVVLPQDSFLVCRGYGAWIPGYVGPAYPSPYPAPSESWQPEGIPTGIEMLETRRFRAGKQGPQFKAKQPAHEGAAPQSDRDSSDAGKTESSGGWKKMDAK